MLFYEWGGAEVEPLDFLEATRHELSKGGVSLVVGRDFRLFKELVAGCDGREALHEQFDIDSGFLSDRAAWVVGLDGEDRVVHTQAVQVVDLNEESLQCYITRNIPNYFPKKSNISWESGRVRAGGRTSLIGGKCCYHGEMWIDSTSRLFERQGLVAALGRYGLALAKYVYDPDIVFGLMSWKLATNGLCERVGYFHCDQSGVLWDRTDKPLTHQLWTVYMERIDLSQMMTIPPIDLTCLIKDEPIWVDTT